VENLKRSYIEKFFEKNNDINDGQKVIPLS